MLMHNEITLKWSNARSLPKIVQRKHTSTYLSDDITNFYCRFCSSKCYAWDKRSKSTWLSHILCNTFCKYLTPMGVHPCCYWFLQTSKGTSKYWFISLLMARCSTGRKMLLHSKWWTLMKLYWKKIKKDMRYLIYKHIIHMWVSCIRSNRVK